MGQMLLRVKIWVQIWGEWKPVLDRLGASGRGHIWDPPDFGALSQL